MVLRYLVFFLLLQVIQCQTTAQEDDISSSATPLSSTVLSTPASTTGDTTPTVSSSPSSTDISTDSSSSGAPNHTLSTPTASGTLSTESATVTSSTSELTTEISKISTDTEAISTLNTTQSTSTTELPTNLTTVPNIENHTTPSLPTNQTTPSPADNQTVPSRTDVQTTPTSPPTDNQTTTLPPHNNHTITATTSQAVRFTFQYNCTSDEIEDYENTLRNAIAMQNTTVGRIQILPACYSTVQLTLNYDKEILMDDLEHKDMIMMKVLNKTYYVTIVGHDPNHSAYTLTKRELYIFIAVAAIIGVLLLLGLIVCIVKCCCKKKKASTSTNLYADRPQYSVDLDSMALTRIPRPSTYASPRDEGLVQPYDTSVVPLEDGQKLDDIQRYRHGPEVSLRTFESRKRMWNPDGSDSTSHIRNGVENPTYAKF